MIFSIQRYLEDYFEKRGLLDTDQYAVKIANIYAQRRGTQSKGQFLGEMRRARTLFYRNNSTVARDVLERDILSRLDEKFKTSKAATIEELFEPGVAIEKKRLRKLQRRSIDAILGGFQRATQARTIDVFWSSRRAGRLRSRSEKIGQGLLTQFLLGVVSVKGGQVLRELVSGVGFVDVVVMLGTVPHLIEMKILRGKFTGPAQLESYMRDESRREGWLLIFDARAPSRKTAIPPVIKRTAGTIKVLVIEINPVVPSRRKD